MVWGIETLDYGEMGMSKKVTISEHRFDLMVAIIMAAVKKDEKLFDQKMNELIMIPMEHAKIERED